MKAISTDFCWMIKNRQDDKKRNSVSLFMVHICGRLFYMVPM